MNKILNNKINNDLTKIIGSYLLPLSNMFEFYFQTLKQLIDRTSYIHLSLRCGDCMDHFGYKWFYDLKDTNIKCIKSVKDWHIWVIRKKLNYS